MATREGHHSQDTELGKLVEKATPVLEQHGNRIILAIAGLLAISAGLIFFIRRSHDAAAVGWTEMASASTAEDYGNIADDYAETAVGTWSRLVEAESYLQSAIQLAFTDRAASNDELQESREGFEKVLRQAQLPSQIKEKALFGLARCIESTSGADTSEAVGAYEKLLAEFPKTIYRSVAEDRVAALKDNDTQDFYAWFRAQNPKPGDRQRPMDGLPNLPEQDIQLPEVPPLLQTPKQAEESTIEADTGTNGSASPAAASTGDAVPQKTESSQVPKAESAKAESAKAETPKAESPKAESPKADDKTKSESKPSEDADGGKSSGTEPESDSSDSDQ